MSAQRLAVQRLASLLFFSPFYPKSEKRKLTIFRRLLANPLEPLVGRLLFLLFILNFNA
jgi:hypothetical protein